MQEKATKYINNIRLKSRISLEHLQNAELYITVIKRQIRTVNGGVLFGFISFPFSYFRYFHDNLYNLFCT